MIGTNAGGNAGVNLASAGIGIFAASDNRIGGATEVERNVISGNGVGVYIVADESPTTGNVVQGNYIGTDVTGANDVGNDLGVVVSAAGNAIGGTATGVGNVISGNQVTGVVIGTFSATEVTGNLVQGNLIGTNAADEAVPNGGGDFATIADRLNQTYLEANGESLGLTAGLLASITGGVAISAADGNTVGGTAQEAGNVISGNLGAGVVLLAADDNFVQGNLIGTNSSGTADVGNTLDGVILLDGASGNTVGGTASGAGNVISGNDDDGVGITEFLTSGNLVQGNLIGTDITGAVVMPNGGGGVSLRDGAISNVIGGTAPGAGNVISGNLGEGVRIANPETQGNQVQGNFIGTNSAGAMLGNGSHGILAIGSGANEIGGSEAGAGNTIAFNGGDGVAVVFAEGFSFFKFIRRNSIFQNVGIGIDLEDDGVTLNDPGDTDIGANDLYNFPVFETVSLDGGDLTLTGFARPDAQIELFIADPDPTGFGEGKTYLTTLVEGSAADSDSGTGTYGPGPINGLVQGTDTTNRFSFTVPLAGLPAAVSAGTVLTATGADGVNTSEFSGNVVVAEPVLDLDFGDAPTAAAIGFCR